jgi:DNA repair exonuclease SbcCD ATPase subunit
MAGPIYHPREATNQLLVMFQDLKNKKVSDADIKAGTVFLRHQISEGLKLEKIGFFKRIILWWRGKSDYDFKRNIQMLGELFRASFKDMEGGLVYPKEKEQIARYAIYYQQLLDTYSKKKFRKNPEEGSKFIEDHSIYVGLKRDLQNWSISLKSPENLLGTNALDFIKYRWKESEVIDQAEMKFLVELRSSSDVLLHADTFAFAKDRIFALAPRVPEELRTQYEALKETYSKNRLPKPPSPPINCSIEEFVTDFERRAKKVTEALEAFEQTLTTFESQSQEGVRASLEEVYQGCEALKSRLQKLTEQEKRVLGSQATGQRILSAIGQIQKASQEAQARVQVVRDSKQIQEIGLSQNDLAQRLEEQKKALSEYERVLDQAARELDEKERALQERVQKQRVVLQNALEAITAVKERASKLISIEERLKVPADDRKAQKLLQESKSLEEEGQALGQKMASLKDIKPTDVDEIEKQTAAVQAKLTRLQREAQEAQVALDGEAATRMDALRASAKQFQRSSDELSAQAKGLEELTARLGVDTGPIADVQRTLHELVGRVCPFQDQVSVEEVEQGEKVVQEAAKELASQRGIVGQMSTQLEAELVKMNAQRRKLLEASERTKLALQEAQARAPARFAREIDEIHQKIEESLRSISDERLFTKQALDGAEEMMRKCAQRSTELIRQMDESRKEEIARLRRNNTSLLAVVSEWARSHSGLLAKEIADRTMKDLTEFVRILDSSRGIEELIAEDRKLSTQCTPEALDAALEREKERKLLLAKGKMLVSQCKVLQESLNVVQPIVGMMDSSSKKTYEAVTREVAVSRQTLEDRVMHQTLDQKIIDETAAHLREWEEGLKHVVASTWEAWEDSIQGLLRQARGCGLEKMVPLLGKEDFLKLSSEERTAYFDQIVKLSELIRKYGKHLKSIQDFLERGFFTEADKRRMGRSELALAEYCLGCEAMRLLEDGKPVTEVTRYFNSVKETVIDRSNRAGTRFVAFRDTRITLVRGKSDLVAKQKKFLSREDETIVESCTKELDEIQKRTRLGATFGSRAYVPAYDKNRTNEPERLEKAIAESNGRVNVIEIEMDALLLKSQCTHLKQVLETLDGHVSAKRIVQDRLNELETILSQIKGATAINVEEHTRRLLDMKRSLKDALGRGGIALSLYTDIFGGR